MSDDLTVTYPRDKQTIAIFTGDGRVIALDDGTSHRWGRETFAPIERAVIVARLRAWADLIESEDAPDPLAYLQSEVRRA